MQVRELSISGAWEFTPRQFGDDRGVFLEWFSAVPFEEATGRRLDLRQANLSVSAAGTVRGIHYADVPPGQAKYVTCVKGAVLDVIVDLRLGSPTFGHTQSVLLDDVDRKAVFLSEGLGHGFCALADGSTVAYVCSTPYAPAREHEIHPMDPALGISWPTTGRHGEPLVYQLSDKDAAAPLLAEARDSGALPTYHSVHTFLAGTTGPTNS